MAPRVSYDLQRALGKLAMKLMKVAAFDKNGDVEKFDFEDEDAISEALQAGFGVLAAAAEMYIDQVQRQD